MKKLIIITNVAFLMLLANNTAAQAFGIKAGFNAASIYLENTNNNYTEETKTTPGFHVGFFANGNLSNLFSIEPSLLFNTKGFRSEAVINTDNSYTRSVKLYYADVAIPLKLAIGGDNTKIYVKAGPYAGFGLFGRNQTTRVLFGNESKTTEDVEWGTGNLSDLKRLDYGLTFGAGLDINNLQIGLAYDYGLADISASNNFGTTLSNRVLRLTFGLRL